MTEEVREATLEDKYSLTLTQIARDREAYYRWNTQKREYIDLIGRLTVANIDLKVENAEMKKELDGGQDE